MKNYQPKPIAASEITPKALFYGRRQFMQAAGAFSLAAMLPKSVWAIDKLADVKKSAYTVGE
jgi:methionine sulfoxide reductase catalytic subunit